MCVVAAEEPCGWIQGVSTEGIKQGGEGDSGYSAVTGLACANTTTGHCINLFKQVPGATQGYNRPCCIITRFPALGSGLPTCCGSANPAQSNSGAGGGGLGSVAGTWGMLAAAHVPSGLHAIQHGSSPAAWCCMEAPEGVEALLWVSAPRGRRQPCCARGRGQCCGGSVGFWDVPWEQPAGCALMRDDPAVLRQHCNPGSV